MNTAIMEGLAKGPAEGEAKGKAEEKLSVARNVKAKGMSPALIAELIGLSLDEVERLCYPVASAASQKTPTKS